MNVMFLLKSKLIHKEEHTALFSQLPLLSEEKSSTRLP